MNRNMFEFNMLIHSSYFVFKEYIPLIKEGCFPCYTLKSADLILRKYLALSEFFTKVKFTLIRGTMRRTLQKLSLKCIIIHRVYYFKFQTDLSNTYSLKNHMGD